tara:strand:+ start:607 stop:831 length:225 start_codon:yes stop_codon:yes gene_type:complete
VTADEKAHNAGDMVLDARHDPTMWSMFNAGVDGSAWSLLRMHEALVERLGEAVQEILNSRAYQQLIPKGSTTET